MAQHFLLSAEARSVSLRKILNYSDDEARTQFAKMRWRSADCQTCPHCGTHRKHRFVPLQKRWRCRDCYKAFSVTSGTVFSSHNISLQLILGAMLLYANAAKGLSALQLCRDLDVQYKTAFVLLHKIRETLLNTRETGLLTGEVEVDGGYMHTYIRPENKKSERKDLRLEENQNKEKCLILVIRQRHQGINNGLRRRTRMGAEKTRTFIIKSENEKDVWAIMKANVDTAAHIFTDEHPAYTLLGRVYEHSVVSHSQEYRADDGANENQAESYFSRLRRFCMGQLHHLKRKHLDVYANEVAFREDWRRRPNGAMLYEVARRCLSAPPSSDWAKYWQGNKRTHDSVVAYG